MTIDRLSGVEPVQKLQSFNRLYRIDRANEHDAISVSKEAQLLSDVNMALNVIRNTPDIREDKVAEVSKKLQDPSYINDTLLNIVADKILDECGY